jgi:hypothetical protein
VRCKTPTHEIEITGAGKEALITMTEKTPNVSLRKRKNVFSFNGEVYSLTKGLLMGDPFLHMTPSFTEFG